MINSEVESLVPFQESPSLFPGQKPCIQTLHRWRMKGVRVAGTPERAKLETLLVGGKRYTSREAVARFIAATNEREPVAAETPSQRSRRSEAARLELEKLGIKTRSANCDQ